VTDTTLPQATCAACGEPGVPVGADTLEATFGATDVFCSERCAEAFAAVDETTAQHDLAAVELYEPPGVAPGRVEPAAQLGQFPVADEWRGLCQMAAIMAGSDLVPAALRRKPNDVLLVLLTGRSLGIDPTTALSQCYVVDGKVTIAPKLRLALLHQTGRGRVVPRDVSAERVTGAVVNRDGQVIEVRTLTMGEVPADLTRKQNWRNYPARMLWWRLAGWLLDDHFPEVGLGIYSPDELGAITDDEGVPIDPTNVTMPPGYGDEPRAPRGDPLAQHRRALAAKVIELSTMGDAAKTLLRTRWSEAGLPKTKDIADMDTLIVADEICETVRAEVAAAVAADERPFTDDPVVGFDAGHDIPEAEVIEFENDDESEYQ
jgi:hypothetical protein